MIRALAALLLAAAALAAPASRDAAREAERLKRYREGVYARMSERTRLFVSASVSGDVAAIAELERYGVRLDGELAQARADFRRLTREYERAALADAVTVALVSRRLETYDKTGVLPPPVKDDGSLARSFNWEAPATPEVKRLPLDLYALTRQLSLPPPPPARERLPAPPPVVARRSPAPAPEPVFQVRGVRRAASVDPLPALIAQLSAREARERAVAADELGACGASAARAVPALRRALADADPRVRASSAAALGVVAPPDPALVLDIRRLLSDRSEDVRLSAQAALQRLGRP